jgi:hypothetical protein
MQGVVKPDPGLDFTSKPDVRLGSKAEITVRPALCRLRAKGGLGLAVGIRQGEKSVITF